MEIILKKNDGGPAFPAESHFSDGTLNAFNEGMTLRDYFAAKAMTTAMSIPWVDVGYKPSIGLNNMEHVARLSYQMADAMLAERAK